MKKHILRNLNISLIIVVLLLLFPLNAKAANFNDSTRKLGDITKDGCIDIYDILTIQRYILGTNPLTGDDFIAADVTSDKQVDIYDILSIQRYILGYSSHFHTYTATIIQNRTCTADEITQYKCDCGDTYTSVTATATGHKEGDWEVDENGNYVRKCTICNAVVENNGPYTGWYENGGNKYCYSNGTKYTGWNSIDSREYYFSDFGILQSKSGIDVSSYQGKINWESVKADGIDYAIIRVGYGNDLDDYGGHGQDDSTAFYNMSECERLNIPYGVYLYCYALSEDDARSEAVHLLRMLDGRNPSMGVYLDVEDTAYYERNNFNVNDHKSQITDFCCIVASTLKEKGYMPGIYSNKNYYDNILDVSRLSGNELWMAIWGPTECPAGNWNMWQYTSNGSVSGIDGRVDMDVLITLKVN